MEEWRDGRLAGWMNGMMDEWGAHRSIPQSPQREYPSIEIVIPIDFNPKI